MSDVALDCNTFAAWVEKLGHSWETGDAYRTGQLFADDVFYRADRFSPPLQGREAVVAYWEEIPRTQKDIRFGYKIVAVTGQTGIAHWWSALERVPSGIPVRLDGIFIAQFDERGQCVHFEEWWQIEEPALAEG